jgi:hypothetical protein
LAAVYLCPVALVGLESNLEPGVERRGWLVRGYTTSSHIFPSLFSLFALFQKKGAFLIPVSVNFVKSKITIIYLGDLTISIFSSIMNSYNISQEHNHISKTP